MFDIYHQFLPLDVEIINAGQLNETEKERLIATLDRIYLMLQKIGFHSEDIERAMLTTKSSRLTDLLDWVCIFKSSINRYF